MKTIGFKLCQDLGIAYDLSAMPTNQGLEKANAKRRGSFRATLPTVALLTESIRHSAIHLDVSQQVIITTEDKLRLKLNNLLHETKRRRAWHAPAGMLLTEVAACVASDFHGALGISGEQWQVLFRVFLLATIFWLIAALVRAKSKPSVDSFINDFKNAPPSSSAEVGIHD